MKRNDETWELSDKEMDFIAMMASIAATSCKQLKMDNAAEKARKMSEEVISVLDADGYYERLTQELEEAVDEN